MRWLVGDIQGCARELERLLRRVRFDEHTDELWCLGDLINRGPDSLETLRLWKSIGGKGILGNHDINALLTHAGKRLPKRNDTLDELFSAHDGPELLGLLREMPVLVHLPPTGDRVRDVWIVHAGLHPRWSDLPALARRFDDADHDDDWLESPDVSFATRVRCCTKKGEADRYAGPPAGCRPPYKRWDSFYKGSSLVVHGHWAQRGFYRGKRTMGLDSGCVYGGELTAWCQEEDRIEQVAAL